MKRARWAVLLGVGMMAGCAFGQTGAVRKGNCDKLDAKGYCVMDAESVTPQLCHIERSLKAITPSPDPSGWREITDLRIVCAGRAVNSEPQDVPAIKGTSKHPTWSCADQSRFLLQSVDGKWHCLRF
jgi:hypothetical protein